MLELKNLKFINMILFLLVLISLNVFITLIIYTTNIEKYWYDIARQKIREAIDIVNSCGAKKNLDLKKCIATGIDGYLYGKEKIVIYNRVSKEILFPFYTGKVSINDTIREILENVGKDIEGDFDTGHVLGYYFFYKEKDYVILIYEQKKSIFFYRNLLIFFEIGLLGLLVIVTIVVFTRREKKNRVFINSISQLMLSAVVKEDGQFELKKIKGIDEQDYERQSLINAFNRMSDKINSLIRRYEKKLKDVTRQRSNFRKLAYLYKKYTDKDIVPDLDEIFVEKFSNERFIVTSLSLKLVNYIEPLNEVYPEVIGRELDGFYRYISSIVKQRGGFININKGYEYNIIFGIKSDVDSFKSAIYTVKDIYSWVYDRNINRNFTGVSWNIASGITQDKGMVTVVGNNIIIMGELIDISDSMMKIAEDYGTVCITNNEKGLRDYNINYRWLDIIDNEKVKGKIFDIIFEDGEYLKDAISLYEHGLEMYFEGNYDIAVSDFKKVIRLKDNDKPSYIILKRIEQKLNSR